MSETVQFRGETAWDAIVNHNSLDIEEEEEFLQYVLKQGYSKESSLEILDELYGDFFEVDSILDISVIQ